VAPAGASKAPRPTREKLKKLARTPPPPANLDLFLGDVAGEAALIWNNLVVSFQIPALRARIFPFVFIYQKLKQVNRAPNPQQGLVKQASPGFFLHLAISGGP